MAKWIDATKKKPSSMTEVLIVTRRRRVTLGHYNSHRDAWFEHECYDEVPVSFWANKPLPPGFED